jgi:hypothetical protein
VRVRRVGAFTHLFPPVPGLGRVFYTALRLPSPAGRAVTLAVRMPLLFDYEDRLGRGYQRFLAGLEPLVLEWLRRAGIEADLEGDRPGPLPPPDRAGLRRLRPLDAEALALVRARDSGLIRYDPAGPARPAGS